MPVSRLLARLGIPHSTWYYWRACDLSGTPARRWPAPVVDEVEAVAGEYAHKWSAWGHRKICAMMRADGVDVSASSVLRAMRRLDLVLPERHLKERRELATARKAAFMEAPTRPNQVWQMDFTEFETRQGGTWRICPVVDYVSKYALAAPVTGTATQRDAIAALEAAIAEAELMAGLSLAEACTDPDTGEITPLKVVTDNGSAFKSTAFMRFMAARPWLQHIRTRHYSPGQNGVVERFNRTLKYEHLYRLEIDDVAELMDEVAIFLELYNDVRPHETIGNLRPIEVHTASHLFRVRSVQES